MKNGLKKLFFLILAALLLIGAARAQEIFAYWIAGGLADTLNADGSATISANGRTVVFFKQAVKKVVYKPYATSTVGGNTFMINAFNIWPAQLEVGATYQVATTKGADGYGADPVSVEVSGIGWDQVNGLKLTLGGGVDISTEALGEPPPRIKFWFGRRAYQKEMVERAEKPMEFVVSAKPDVKVEVNIDLPYTLAPNIDAYSMVIDKGTPTAKNIILNASNIEATVYASGTGIEESRISGRTIIYSVADPLSEGNHTFSVTASSSGLIAKVATATEIAKVSVLGGPLRMIGNALTYPSPFSISKHKTVTIQYTLSADANIDIYLISVAGERIKKFTCLAGGEGGAAGVNKVTWDGRADQGFLAGNAIYVGTIVARDDNRLLGKLKLTIVD